MTVLYIGSKFDGHDSSIFLIQPDKKDICGLSTERVTGFKHDDIFPIPALERIIEYKNIKSSEIKKIHFSNSFTSDWNKEYAVDKFEIDLANRTARGASPHSKSNKQQHSNIVETINQCIERHLRRLFPFSEIFIRCHDHEYCHALSSYFFADFETALLITMDGSGDDGVFSRAYIAEQGELTPIGESQSKHRIFDPVSPNKPFSKHCSIGGIYSYFTYKLGFRPDCDEGKVEGLAALGVCVSELYEQLMESVSIDNCNHAILIDIDILRKALRYPLLNNPISIEDKSNLAATVQRFTEEVVLDYIKLLVAKTHISKLCLSGGVFANVILNMKIFETISEDIYVAPAMGDDGSAQGAAIAELIHDNYTYADLGWLRNNQMPYFGTSFSRSDILNSLSAIPDKINFQDQLEEWPEKVASLIHSGSIGAVFQGRMEWGPRALGNRSILVSPVNPKSKEIINEKIKKRHFFQPVCPAILAEEMTRLFERGYMNNHMTCAFKMKPEFHSCLPGAIHVDGTSRVQFVRETDNQNLHRLLLCLKELSGYGVVLNTSFNMHGRTIVESPKDALQDFLDTGLDFLLIEGYLVTRV